MNEDLPRKIEDTLNSLEGLKRAEANPFLYSRIRGRLEEPVALLSRQWRWRVAVAMIVLLLLNLATLNYLRGKRDIEASEASVVAQEYSINSPQSY